MKVGKMPPPPLWLIHFYFAKYYCLTGPLPLSPFTFLGPSINTHLAKLAWLIYPRCPDRPVYG